MKRYDSYLSHHEELRLDYLQKNIHFLNDKEKRELSYLKYKAQGYLVEETPRPVQKRRPAPVYREIEEDDWPLDYRASKQKRYQAQPEKELEDEFDVPTYPREVRSRRTRRPRPPKAEKVRVPKQEVRMPIAEEIPQVSAPKVKRPRKKGRIKRFLKIVALLFLMVVAVMLYKFYRGTTLLKNNPNYKPIQAEVFNGQKTRDGVNILMLGTDGRVGETSDVTRTDTIMVVNISNKDKKIKMVSFMRDILINLGGNDYKINSAYTFGEQNNHQGAENVRQVLKEHFDLDIQHYALIDFSTFATAIDSLFPEGVLIDAKFATIGGEKVTTVDVPDDLMMKNGVVPNQTIKVGKQRMDGRTLLNYARFRKDDDGDNGRARRQQQVMSAILSQVKDPTKLFTGSEALGKIYSQTSTSIPFTFMLTNGAPAVLDGGKGVERLTVPELGDWKDEFDVYGGQGLRIDFEKYKEKLKEMGFR